MTAPRKGKAEPVRMKPMRAWACVSPRGYVTRIRLVKANLLKARDERIARVLVTEVEK